MPAPSPANQLAGLMANYDPEIAKLAKTALGKLRKLVPGAVEMVYDNYNALVIGFGPSERASEAIFSIALYPRWVNLFLFQGAKVPDPDRLLQGKGSTVRSIRMETAELLDEPAVVVLIDRALAHAKVPMPNTGRRRLIIKAVADVRRSRRPA